MSSADNVTQNSKRLYVLPYISGECLFIPEVLKRAIPALNLDTPTVANRGVS